MGRLVARSLSFLAPLDEVYSELKSPNECGSFRLSQANSMSSLPNTRAIFMRLQGVRKELIKMAALDYKMLMKLEREAFREKQGNWQSASASDKWSDAVQLIERSAPPVTPDLSAEDGRNWMILASSGSIYDNRVGDLPAIYYSPDAVDEETASTLLNNVEITGHEQASWIQLKARRLQCWGDFPKATSGASSDNLSAPMPRWLGRIIDSLVEQGVFAPGQRPNNVLINQYGANEGILHHTDGPAYHDRVAILSLGSECVMSFRRKLTSEEIGTVFAGDVCSVVLAPRSLLVFEGDAYSKHMHGIEIDQPVQRVEEHGPCANLHLVTLPTDADGNHLVSTLFLHFGGVTCVF